MEREGERLPNEDSEQSVGRGSSTTSRGVKRQKGDQHQREGRETHCVGIDAPRIAFKMETLAQANTPF